MVKRYLFLFMFLLTLSGCEGILDSYDEHFGPTVNLWGEEYSVKNTIELDLSNTGLTRSIPSKIGDLKNLERIYLSRNQLSGEIPPEIGHLTNLTSLNLSDNQLTGEIPFEFGNLTNLRYLNLNDNQLIGEISENICNLNIIWYTTTYGLSTSRSSIENNQFCPPYPSCISVYTGQQDISNCWDCEEDGVVELWGKCYSIEYTTRLDLSNSGLTGSIPMEIGDLINLERLYLHENQLTGEIPSEIGNLINLRQLNLSDNQLSGLIPNEICSLDVTWYNPSFSVFIQTSSVYNNQLCPPYPSCLNGNYYMNGLGPFTIVGNQNTSNCN